MLISKKKLLITGVAGFIGSHLCHFLLNKYRIIGIDDFSSGTIENMTLFINNPDFTFIQSSLQEITNLDELISSCDIVIHLAAIVGILKTFNNPLLTLENNINCSELVIKSCYKNNIPLLFASSSEVYGNQSTPTISEDSKSEFDHILSLRMPYSISKIIDEMKINLLNMQGMRCIVTRLFNVIGPNQTSRYGMVVPKFIKQAINCKPITVFGDGSQIRTFCDIRDLLRAFDCILETSNFEYKVFNVGGRNEISILNLAQKIVKITNSKSEIIFIPYHEIHDDYEEIFYRKPLTSKFESAYNWKSQYSIEDSVRFITKSKYNHDS